MESENETKIVALQGLLEVLEEGDEDLLRKLRALHRCLEELPQGETTRMSLWGLLRHSKFLMIALRTLPESLKRRIAQLQEQAEEEKS